MVDLSRSKTPRDPKPQLTNDFLCKKNGPLISNIVAPKSLKFNIGNSSSRNP